MNDTTLCHDTTYNVIQSLCIIYTYSFLVIDTTLSSDNLLIFRKNLNATNDGYQRSN